MCHKRYDFMKSKCKKNQKFSKKFKKKLIYGNFANINRTV